jgi:hypothetical protein
VYDPLLERLSHGHQQAERCSGIEDGVAFCLSPELATKRAALRDAATGAALKTNPQVSDKPRKAHH